MRFQILTQFPERYESYIESGLPARAAKKGLFELKPVQVREYADPGRKGRIDDAPYGGGPGMVLQVGPIHRAVESLSVDLPVVLFTPRGRPLNQRRVRDFAAGAGYTLICGYYEGIDERVARHIADHQISIGPFVLGSGDLAALCFIEAVTRLIPGYMGCAESGNVESHENEMIEYPQYTRPADYNGWSVPDVLLSGDHGAIEQWRRAEQETSYGRE